MSHPAPHPVDGGPCSVAQETPPGCRAIEGLRPDDSARSGMRRTLQVSDHDAFAHLKGSEGSLPVQGRQERSG